MAGILAFLFDTVEAAQAAVKPLAGARLIAQELRVNLVSQRFALGATPLRSPDGVADNLSVQRADMLFALSVVKRAGLPFRLALLAPRRETRESSAPEKSKKP